MKFLVISLTLMSFLVHADNKPGGATVGSTFENPNYNPAVEEAQLPGTPIQIDEVNSSPNPTAVQNESEKFRGTLTEGKYIQDADGLTREEKSREKKQSQKEEQENELREP